jgi:hypothetical protein
MEFVNKLEKTIEGWLKPVPHLPEKGRKWLANNVWWLALIGVVLSVLSAVSAFYTALFTNNYLDYIDSFYKAYGIESPSYGLWGLNMSMYMLVMYIGIVVGAIIMSMAINHLKSKHEKGWDLMFLAMLVSVVIQLISLLFNLGNLIGGILSVAIGATIGSYLLFEIKPYFEKVKTTKKSE